MLRNGVRQGGAMATEVLMNQWGAEGPKNESASPEPDPARFGARAGDRGGSSLV